ncbi:alginate export family protein [Bradyrhizobium sp. NBAIM14]|uniref:alginate export family protein n=1 Tax=Bradyrhizobium sp. NBAIM14 TaxID=2793814 RepID=UPI001CD576DB|nr:alginate export family protein [Bradyrhizobium sp. NBAIM14]MCA1500074.1 alginate export family protein [Bradyrhizobium sp. NBAIM14]
MAQETNSTGTENDPFDALKNIPLSSDGSVYVHIGGQTRIRSESSNHLVFGLAQPPHNDALLIRSFILADFHLGPYLRTFVQLGTGQAPIWNGTLPATQLDRFDLLQGYGELMLPSAGGSFMLRAGRQEMSFGSSRLVSVRESPNIRRAFDGARTAWIVSPDTRIDAFVVRPVLNQTGVFDDRSDTNQAFWGVYATSPVPGISELKADLYYFGLDRGAARFAQGVADEHRHTVGARLFGKANEFDWDFEGAYQFGSFGAASISAWTVSGSVGYTLQDVPFSPRIGLNADVISGDHNLHDGTLGTFNPLFPKLPYFSEANLVGPANLIDIQPNLTLTLVKNVTLNVGWNPLWKESTADAYYGPAVTPVAGTAGGSGRYMGQQISTTLTWTPTKHLTLGGTYVNYTPGERIREAGGKPGSFVAAWATISF